MGPTPPDMGEQMRSSTRRHPRNARHPLTGRPLEPVGFRRDGRPIWPIMGGSGDGGEGGGVGGSGDGGDGGTGGGSGEGTPPPGNGNGDGGDGGDRGFPENTPVAEMTADQQVAYWKFQARKHEDRNRSRGDYDDLKKKAGDYDALLESQKTEQQKAVDAARGEGKAEGLREAGVFLVEAEVRAQSANRLSDEQRAALLDGLDRTRFLNADNTVDADKVKTLIDGLAPSAGGSPDTGKKWPDMGQGRRDNAPKTSVAAGREAWETRRKNKK